MLNSEEKQAGQQKLSILPNPSSGQALLKLPEGLESKDIEIRIIDMTGKLLIRYPLRDRYYSLLDGSPLADGIYLVALCSENRILTRGRWVVSH